MNESNAMKSVSQFSLRPVLDAIGRGEMFRMVVSIIVQLLAVLLLIAGVIGLIRVTWEVLSNSPRFGLGLGAILTFLFGLVALVAACHILWLRGGDIRRLGASEFTVMPIAALLIRLYGEVIVVVSLIIGVLAMLLIWLGGDRLIRDIFDLIHTPMPRWFGNAFMNGIVALFVTWLWGFLILLACYLVAELIMVLFSIARNTERIP